MTEQITLEKRLAENNEVIVPKSETAVKRFLDNLIEIRLKDYLWAYPQELKILCDYYRIPSDFQYLQFIVRCLPGDNPLMLQIAFLPFYGETAAMCEKKKAYCHDPEKIRPFQERYAYAQLMSSYADAGGVTLDEFEKVIQKLCAGNTQVTEKLSERIQFMWNFFGRSYRLISYFGTIGTYLVDKADGSMMDRDSMEMIETLLVLMPRWYAGSIR